MFTPDQYELIDFGRGRKLERFGSEILDRPSPASEGVEVADPTSWANASARFDLARGGKGQWDNSELAASYDDEPWSVGHGDSRLIVSLNASGNVGLFPEQAGNWDWIGEQVKQCANGLASRRPRVLNLFAYTGGASLAAASAGAEVAHVDSSGPTVTSAKKNAELSGMADLPIRWLVEDAIKFVARETRRGNHYDGVIADPPTYGHGPKGKAFKFEQHVGELLKLCGELLGAERPGEDGESSKFLLFSCHAPGFDENDAVSAVSHVVPNVENARLTGRPLVLQSRDGRKLSAGVSARWTTTIGDSP